MQPQQDKNKNPKLKSPKFNALWIYLPLMGLLCYMYFFGAKGGDPLKTEWIKVKEQMISQGDVEKILFVTNNNKAEVTIKQDSLKKYKNLSPFLFIPQISMIILKIFKRTEPL